MRRVVLFGTAVLVSLCGTGVVQCYAQQQANTVCLDQSRNWRVRAWDKRERGQLLCRELVRQAFLIAARDELGLATRDAWLGDGMPTDGDNAPWDIISKAGESSSIVELVRGFAGKQTSLVREEFASALSGDPCGWARRAEELSRTKFVDALKRTGFQGSPPKRDESIRVPTEVETLLGEMNLLSQFRALRELHELIRSKGESVALTGGLVRGYANLGLMTDQYWHPIHKVFKARAILYAQRMMYRTQESPVAFWHRAYAAALAGDHRWALDDLAKVEKKLADSHAGDRPTEPPWVQVIGQFCRFEIEKLGQHVNDPKVGELAALLRFLDVVQEAGGDAWLEPIAIETLKIIPQCYRVCDALMFETEFAARSTLRSARSASVKSLGKAIYLQLDSMRDLSDEVRRIVKVRIPGSSALANLFALDSPKMSTELKVRGPLTDALIQTGQWHATAPGSATADRDASVGEPSWAALGILLRELTFTQIYAHVVHRPLVYDEDKQKFAFETLDKWLQNAGFLMENHPYRAFVESWRDRNKADEALAQLAKVDPTGCVCQTIPACLAIADKELCRRWWQEIDRNCDLLAGDFQLFIHHGSGCDDEWRTAKARWLNYLSPHSPLAREELLINDWQTVQSSALEWEKEAAPFPHLLSLLGKRYAQIGRWDVAERCLKAAVKRVPSDPDHYKQLAVVYEKQGKADLWLSALEEYIKRRDADQLEDNGTDNSFERALTLMEIAHYYMKEGSWDKALPYAQRAATAESIHARFINYVAECYEGAHRWSEAEQWYKTYTERGRLFGLKWYFFCRRTGKGDLDAARAFARSIIDSLDDKTESPEWTDLSTYYLLEGQPEKAQSIMKKAAKRPIDWGCRGEDVLWLAMISDQLKDGKTRGEALALARGQELKTVEHLAERNANEVCITPKPKANGVIVLIDIITKDLSQGGKGQIDFDAADKLIADVGDDEPMVRYFLAQYLNVRGQREAAERYWKRVMSWYEQSIPVRTLAAAALLERGTKSGDNKELQLPNDSKSAKPAPKVEAEREVAPSS